MRSTRVMVAALIGVASLVATNPAEAKPKNPVAGDWSTVDDLDASALTLRITNGRNFQVFFDDDGATVCADAGLGFVPASLKGRATVTNSAPLEFHITSDIVCHTERGRRVVTEDFVLGFTYDAGTDTLVDTVGECWARPGLPECTAS